jgi:hypothetical protein
MQDCKNARLQGFYLVSFAFLCTFASKVGNESKKGIKEDERHSHHRNTVGRFRCALGGQNPIPNSGIRFHFR